ncbi:hypothetical protein KI387_027076, partial [Taxus chinensis]
LNKEASFMAAPKDPVEETTIARATIVRKNSGFKALLQTLKDELKKSNQALNMCATSDTIIRIKTLKEDNEVLKEMKDETLRKTKRLAL